MHYRPNSAVHRVLQRAVQCRARPVHYSALQCTTVHYSAIQYTTDQIVQCTVYCREQCTAEPDQFTTVHNSTLQSITVYYSALQCTTVHYIVLQCTTDQIVQCTVYWREQCTAEPDQCTTVHNSALQCITVYYIALQCTTVHYIVLQCTKDQIVQCTVYWREQCSAEPDQCTTVPYSALQCTTMHYIALQTK